VVSDGSTWGGRITARIDQSLPEDVAEIEGRGFVILATDLRAGESRLWVYGSALLVGMYLQDPDLKIRLPAYFFPIPKGTEVNLAVIKQWTPYRQLAY